MQSVQDKPSLLQRLQSRETPPEWSFVTALFFVIAYVVMIVAGQALVATLSGASLDSPSAGVFSMGALLGALVAAGGVIQWARRRLGPAWIGGLRLVQPINPPVTAIALFGLGAAWVIDLIGVLLRLKGDQVVPPVLVALRSPIGVSWVVTAVLSLIAQPIADGLVFAGLFYPALARDLKNNVAAVIITAVAYTAVNLIVLPAGTATWYALIQPFLMALVMLLVRAYTQSTQSAIVARAFFGFFFILSALVSISIN